MDWRHLRSRVNGGQDLVYFWTGSPALPASEEGFQTMPSVTIRCVSSAYRLQGKLTCVDWCHLRSTVNGGQDLVHFWTGSPALPTSEEGFQPMLSVTIRCVSSAYRL